MKTLAPLALLLGLLSSTAATAAAPPNDSTTKAIVLNGNYSNSAVVYDLNTATAATTDPMINGSPAGRTLWFVSPAKARSGNLDIVVSSNTGAGFVSMYNILDLDNPAGSLSPIGSSVAFAAGGTATVTAFQSAGRIAILVSGIGKFTISHRFSDLSVSNDFRANAQVLTGDKGSWAGNNLFAAQSPDESLPLQKVVHGTVWYAWTPTFTGKAVVETSFSYLSGGMYFDPGNSQVVHDTYLAVMEGATLLAEDDDSGPSSNSRLLFDSVAGHTYHVAVATYNVKPSGSFTLNYAPASVGSEIFFANLSNTLGVARGDAGTIPIYVRRRYSADAPCSCALATVAGGSAVAGQDYMALNTTVNFGTGEWEKIVQLTVLPNAANTFGRLVNLALANPAFASLAVNDSTGHATIETANPVVTPTLLAVPDNLVVSESSASSLVVRIERAGDSGALEELNQYVVGSDAIEGQDFFLGAGVILPSGASSATVTFTPISDNIFEADETVTISVGGQASYEVTIVDDDPYIPIRGKLVAPLTYASATRPAVFQAAMSANGSVTGKINLMGKTVAISGKLDDRGKMSALIALPGRSAMLLALAAQDQQGTFKVDLYDDAAAVTRLSSASVVMQNYAPVINPCPWAAAHTVYGGNIGAIGTSVVASAKVDAAGNAVVAGRIFDGAAFTAAGCVDGDGELAALAMLYGGSGGVSLSSTLPDGDGIFTQASLRLIRAARAGDPAKIGAIATAVAGTLARYTPPPPGQPALAAWSGGSGKAVLSGGGLANTITKAITVTAASVITAPLDAEALKLTVVPGTGWFSGSFVPPGATKALPIQGVLIDLPGANNQGIGFFFTGLKGGTVKLTGP